jgi:hypothetical protein
MPEHGPRARHTPCACRLRVGLAELLDQAGSRHAREDCSQRSTERDRWQHQVLESAAPGNGKPAKLHAEDDGQERAEPEVRHRHSRQREGHRCMVDYCSAPDSGGNSQRNRDDEGNGDSGEGEFEGRRKTLQNLAWQPV